MKIFVLVIGNPRRPICLNFHLHSEIRFEETATAETPLLRVATKGETFHEEHYKFVTEAKGVKQETVSLSI